MAGVFPLRPIKPRIRTERFVLARLMQISVLWICVQMTRSSSEEVRVDGRLISSYRPYASPTHALEATCRTALLLQMSPWRQLSTGALSNARPTLGPGQIVL
jgi:hypothetical protein